MDAKIGSTLPYGFNGEIGEGHQKDSDLPTEISFPSLKRNKKTSNKIKESDYL